MREESWFYRLLKRIGLIKTYEVSKKEMCERAKSICSKTVRVVLGMKRNDIWEK